MLLYRDRTLFDGLDGVETWCGFGVFAPNGIKISGLIAAAAVGQPEPVTGRQPDRRGAGPPGNQPAPVEPAA